MQIAMLLSANQILTYASRLRIQTPATEICIESDWWGCASDTTKNIYNTTKSKKIPFNSTQISKV